MMLLTAWLLLATPAPAQASQCQMACGAQMSDCLEECVQDHGTTDTSKFEACSKVCGQKTRPCMNKCEKPKKAKEAGGQP
jgi:hypothetical protein